MSVRWRNQKGTARQYSRARLDSPRTVLLLLLRLRCAFTDVNKNQAVDRAFPALNSPAETPWTRGKSADARTDERSPFGGTACAPKESGCRQPERLNRIDEGGEGGGSCAGTSSGPLAGFTDSSRSVSTLR
ncbi:unnamed protein product [Lampetra planeri]